MAEIKPFKAVLYNQDKVKDLVSVTCPPYDVIDADAQENYYNLSPYNMVRLILGHSHKDKALPRDNEGTADNNKYADAEKQLNDWLNRGILYQAKQEAIYFYEQEYVYPIRGKTSNGVYFGEKKKRQGFIALLKIDDTNASIYAHEHTHPAPKQDRLQLLREVKANLSPIFVIFPDKNLLIKRISDKYSVYPCLIDIKSNSIRHRLWSINDDKTIDEIRRDLRSRHIFIADGHHRYEVACIFRREMHEILGCPDKELACDYVLTYFTNLYSRGLTVLPTHRVIRDVEEGIFVRIGDELNKYFDIYRAKNRSDLFLMLDKAGRKECVLGIYKAQPDFGKENKFFLLRLKSGINIDKIIHIDKPMEYKRLSVVILNQLILGKILKFELPSVLGNDADLDNRGLFYTDDADLAVKMVDERKAKMVFFLNPVKVEEMAHLALQGHRLPPKSTFFYPKLLSGLVMYKY